VVLPSSGAFVIDFIVTSRGYKKHPELVHFGIDSLTSSFFVVGSFHQSEEFQYRFVG
jgi:hypothetical protein